uniref:Forkhead box protein O n=1 Tax=Bursaphelenchus xylophilus TaxID=6326 RepID=A0A1I7RY46_BURXY
MSSAAFDAHHPVVVSASPSTSGAMNPSNQLSNNCPLNFSPNMNNNMFATQPYGQQNLGLAMQYLNGSSNSSSSLSETPPNLGLRHNLIPASTDSSTSTLSNNSMTEQVLLINSGQGTVCTTSYVNQSNDYNTAAQEAEEPEPMSRDRCNTWPLRRPNLETGIQNKTMIQERIPEEESPFGNDELLSSEIGVDSAPGNDSPRDNSPLPFGRSSPGDSLLESDANGGKKVTTRRNAWGNMSYADLITQAILSSPEKRLTLSQVYEWMVQNVPYFRDKGDSNSSAGWKMNNFLDQPTEFRGRCRTWPTNPVLAKPEQYGGLSYGSNNQSSSSLVSSRYPSTQCVASQSSWSQLTSSLDFTDTYTISGNSYDDIEAAHSQDKRRRVRRRHPENLSQKKSNPWGDESYADLIARALESTPDGRLRLNEIYQWFVENLDYFRERSGPEEAAGWKNSIRHNLSLHSRFMRVQNEGAGKSSWWVINPDAKPGRNPRRRAATMESSTKTVFQAALEKKRRGARKRVEMGIRGSMQSINETSSQLSINSHDTFNDTDDGFGSQFETFRGRTQSNVSMPGGLSPQQNSFEDFEFPPWAASNGPMDMGPPPQVTPQNNQAVNELLDRTDQMRLDSENEAARRLNNGLSLSAQHSPQFMPQIKEEPKECVQSHSPMFHEIPQQQMRQNMMQHCAPTPHNMISQHPKPASSNASPYYTNNGYVHSNVPTQNPSTSQWTPYRMPPQPIQTNSYQQRPMMMGMGMQPGRPMNDLPMDLENLANLDSRIMDCDVEAVLRHEMSQSDSPQLQLHFDI